MLDEELDKIKKCEAAAAQMKRRAKAAAKKLVGDSVEEGRQIVREAEKKAEGIYAGFTESGVKEAGRLYDSYMDRVKAQCAALEQQARERGEAAADMIVERIVGRDGDS